VSCIIMLSIILHSGALSFQRSSFCLFMSVDLVTPLLLDYKVLCCMLGLGLVCRPQCKNLRGRVNQGALVYPCTAQNGGTARHTQAERKAPTLVKQSKRRRKNDTNTCAQALPSLFISLLFSSFPSFISVTVHIHFFPPPSTPPRPAASV
jgi:hypothetical protein